MFMLSAVLSTSAQKRLNLMPFNAGVVDATPTRRTIHLSFIDSDAKVRTDSYDIPVAATDAEINAFANAIGGYSNASLWDVVVTGHFATGVASKANAVDETNDSVADNLVMLFKTLDNRAIDVFIPANDETDTMVVGTENPDPAKLASLVTAAQALFAGYTVASYRMSERRKKNRAIKA